MVMMSYYMNTNDIVITLFALNRYIFSSNVDTGCFIMLDCFVSAPMPGFIPEFY